MTNEVRFGEFRFDRDADVLYREAELVQVPPRALAVLGCLIAGGGDVVTKEQILETAWPDSFVAEDSLTHAISVLRGALGDDPRKPEFIQTVPRRGYRFVAPLPPGVDDVVEAAAESRPWLVVAGGVAAVLVVAALWIWLSGQGVTTSTPDFERIRRLALAVEAGDGIGLDTAATRELLVDRIEQDTGLAVVAAEEEAGATLTVAFERNEDRVQVTARVRGAADNRRWWGQEWNLPIELYEDDLFARSLLSRMQFLLDVVSADSAVRGSTSTDAMIRAVHASDLLLGEAQHDLQKFALQAAAELRRAVEMDPEFTRARAGEIAIRVETEEWRNLTPQEIEDAERDIASALQTDPADPVVHVAAALLAKLRGDVEQMASELDQALTLDPSLFWIYMSRAGLELAIGRGDVALATATRGVDYDPYLPSLLGTLIDVHLWLGDIDAAEETLRTLAAIDVTADGVGGYWSGRSRFRILVARDELAAAEEALLAMRVVWANSQWIHRLEADFYEQQGNAAAAAAAMDRLESLRRE